MAIASRVVEVLEIALDSPGRSKLSGHCDELGFGFGPWSGRLCAGWMKGNERR